MTKNGMWSAALALGACMSCGHAWADVSQADEYMKRLKIAQTVQPAGESPFGEQINLYTGELSFQQSDVTVEGIGPTISLVRTSQSLQTAQTVQRPLTAGQWSLSIPRIETLTSQGWTVGPVNDPNKDARCTHFDRPYPKQLLNSEWWQGMDMVTEDGNRQTLLKRAAQNTAQPAMTLNGQPVVFPAVTQQNWQIGCLPATSNGAPGEAFLAVSPDGTRYWFDRLYFEQAETFYERDDLSGTLIRQQRALATMYVTRIEDRFGNWLAYQYTGDKLASITASDGRSVTLQWRADSPVVDRIIVQPGASQRVWWYEYSAASATSATLSAVVLPDGSRWTFDATPFASAPITHANLSKCTTRTLSNPAGSTARTMVHPSGLVGSFTTAGVWHARSYVPSYCHTPVYPQEFEPYEDNPPLFGTPSLISKTFSGPGLANRTWTYAYSPAQGSTSYDACAATQTCAATAWVDVTDPEGNRTRHTHSTRFDATETKLLQVDVHQGANTLLRSETRGYAASNTGPYPAILGGSMIAGGYNGLTGGTWTPLNSKTIAQQGVNFTWQANGFDTYANALSTTRASSLGYSRTDTTVYHHETNKWVIGQVASSTNANTGLIESQTDYDANALPWKTYAFGKLQQTLAYNANGTLASATDGNNHATTFGNWKRGIPQTLGFADGTGKSAVVDDLGQIASVTNEVGAKTCYGYDAVGRINRITHPSEAQPGQCNQDNWLETTIGFALSAEAKYGLPANHWRRTEATGNARKITFYDALWRPMVQETYDLSNTGGTLSQSVTRYDSDGRPVFQSYPQRNMLPAVYNTWADPAQIPNALGTWTTYDAMGRPIQAQQNSEHGLLTSTTEYLNGFQTRSTDARGQQTTVGYMAYDQPGTDWARTIAHPEGAITDIHRDVFGKPLDVSRHNADFSQWSGRYYAYDAYQRLCKRSELETGTTAFGYDDAGNQIWSATGLSWSPNAPCEYTSSHSQVVGKRVDRTYDARNRLKTLKYPDGYGNQVWTYTPDGLPDTVTAYNGPNQSMPVVTAYHYNQRRMLNGQGESSSQPSWYSWGIGYGYDVYGNLAVHAYPTGLSVSYAPNALGQATQVSSPGQTYASGISYYPNGGIQQFTYGNGIMHTMTQNARQLPQASADSGGVLGHQYSYDYNGNVTQIQDLNRGNDYSRWMTYDGLNRLKSAGSCSFGPGCWFYYDYDALDNLTRVQSPGGVDRYYCYDARQLLTNLKSGPCASGASVVGLGYDVRGNLNNKNGQVYVFDYGNRLREATGKEGYRYDGLGRRVTAWQAASNTVTVSQYSQAGQLFYEENSSAALRNEYVYLSGSLLAKRETVWSANGATTVKYQHTDALGTPVAETGPTGAVLQRSEYDPYGRLNNRPLTNGPGYTGHYQDAATGLTYMQQRYYDPVIGRFLSMDPVTADPNTGGNFNRYWYANNNPYRFTDPDGRQAADCNEACMRMRNKSDGFSGVRTSFRSPIDMGAAPFRAQNYTTKPGVTLSQPTSIKVGNLADSYNEATGKKLVVTDGSRTAQDQASRMHYKISNGEGVRLYANRAAANEVLNAYNDAIGARLGRNEVISSMAGVISDQMVRGVYISGHLRDGAVDFRSRDLTGSDRQAFREAAGTSKVLLEGVPPHFHVEF